MTNTEKTARKIFDYVNSMREFDMTPDYDTILNYVYCAYCDGASDQLKGMLETRDA